MQVSVELEGADRLARVFERATSAGAIDELKQAITATAATVLDESLKIVPVDLGALKGSAMVKEPKVDATGIEVEITYGGPSAPYAGIVHEDMKARHKDGKTAKYLEIPVEAARPTFVRSVMARYARNLRRTA
jgi:metal-sulfur cluster biosynthetic enzyme